MAETTATILSLLADTRQMTLKTATTTPGTLTISLTVPSTLTHIDGVIVLLSSTAFDPSMTPVSGQRYIAGLDIATFAGSRIGNSYVVFSASKSIGQTLPSDITFLVTNLDPTDEYFVCAYGVSNTFGYSPSPIFGYLLEENSGNIIPATFSGSIPSAPTAPTAPTLGQVYYDLRTGHVKMWTGSIWIDASAEPIRTGNADAFPITPEQGEFFYDTTTRMLFAFDGTSWNRADTAEQDSPMVEKLGVGTDGSHDERARLIDVLKVQLGSPTVCVEVGEAGFDIAIDNALDEFRRRADNAYNMQYVIFPLKPGQSKYYLNDPRSGSNRVVNVVKIHRVNTMGLGSITGEMSVYAQTFFQQMYTGGGFDILSIHMMASLSEDYQRIFAGDLSFLWDESTRQLQILKTINKDEKVILECAMERTEQDLLSDRWAKQWLQAWAMSELLEQLGLIRSKFGSLPGAGGGITLNGSELLAMAAEHQVECLRQIQDFEVGNGGVNFQNASFLIG